MADIFDHDDQSGEGSEDILSELVGEGKKFKTVQDLAKSKLEADAFIEKLKDENAQALEELKRLQEAGESKVTVSELLKSLKESNKEQFKHGEPTLSEDRLHELVKNAMREESAASTKARNRELANRAVLEKVNGDVEAAKTFIAERAKQLGMPPAKLAALSEESPNAFIELVGLSKSTSSTPSVRDIKSGNTSAVNNTERKMEVDGHKTKAYYDALKKEMGTYNFLMDKKLQKRYLDDAMALGVERFNQ